MLLLPSAMSFLSVRRPLMPAPTKPSLRYSPKFSSFTPPVATSFTWLMGARMSFMYLKPRVVAGKSFTKSAPA